MKYEHLALQFVETIEALAAKPDNLNNLASYLTYHFPEWLEKYASTPTDLVCELREFANMEI